MSDRRLRMPIECAQLLIHYLVDNQPCESVMYLQKQHIDPGPTAWAPAAFDDGAADVVATRIKQWLQDSWNTIAGDSAAATGVDVVWNSSLVTPVLHGKSYQDSDYPIPGTDGTTGLPNNCTVAVTLKTALLGRSYHGRTYHVGLNSTLVHPDAPNVLTPAAVASIPAAYNDLRDRLMAGTGIGPPQDRFPVGVMSFRHAGADRNPAIWTVGDHYVLTDSYVDSMRRRLPGHNRHG